MKYEEMPYSRIDFVEETRYLKELMKRFQAAKSAKNSLPFIRNITKWRDTSRPR